MGSIMQQLGELQLLRRWLRMGRLVEWMEIILKTIKITDRFPRIWALKVCIPLALQSGPNWRGTHRLRSMCIRQLPEL